MVAQNEENPSVEAPQELMVPSFELGQEAYSAANFPLAIAHFKGIIEQAGKEVTAEMYYNLGAAYYKNGNLSEAILNFHRAYRLSPSDRDIRFNLNLATSQIQDRIEPTSKLMINRWLDNISHWFSLPTWMWVGGISFVIGLVGFLFFLLHESRQAKKAGFIGGVVFLLLSLLANVMVYRSYHFIHDRDEAILMAPIITVKSAPDSSSQDIVVVHSGLKVEMLQKLSGYTEIELPDGTVGWVADSELETIYHFD